MQDNAVLMRNFSAYKKKGIISTNEFCIISQYLLDADSPAPSWVAKLDNACKLLKEREIEIDDFHVIKNQILSVNGKCASTPVVRAEVVKQGPANASAVRKEETASIVRNCTIAACLIGLLPLPVADAPFLIITQFIMLRKLCAKYDRSPGAALLLIILSAILGPVVFGAFVKLIPVAGSIIGACVAGGFTWYIGSKVKAMLENGQEFTLDNFKATPISD